MKSQINSTLHPAKIWTDIHSLESSAIEQIKNAANLPWVHKHVAIMPDAHTGYGAFNLGRVLRKSLF